jgi:hypothetical protein
VLCTITLIIASIRHCCIVGERIFVYAMSHQKTKNTSISYQDVCIRLSHMVLYLVYPNSTIEIYTITKATKWSAKNYKHTLSGVPVTLNGRVIASDL